jgi:hypothetical protein
MWIGNADASQQSTVDRQNMWRVLPMHNYKELKVWQKAMDVVVTVYELTRSFPKDELFGLTSQLRRAAVSIPLNIAEGAGCNSDLEFARFLDIC